MLKGLWERCKEAWLRPKDLIQALLKDPANRKDYWPGTRAYLWVDLGIWALVMAVVWAVFGTLFLLLCAFSWKLAWLWSLLLGVGIFFMNPFSLAWSFAQDACLGLACFWAWSHCQDWVFRRIFNHAGGLQIPLYNVMLLATLPWVVFIVVPVLGWIVAIVGSLWTCYLVVKRVYQEVDPIKVIAAATLALVPISILQWVLSAALGWAGMVAHRADPIYPWLDNMAHAAAASTWAPAIAVAEPVTEADQQAERQRQWQAAADRLAKLEELQRRTAPKSSPSGPPSANAIAAAVIETQEAAPVVVTPVPTLEPTLEPTPVPTAGNGLGEAIGKEAARQGAADAGRLLRLFH